MQLELQARGDAEVRAGAAEAPEQLRLLVRGGAHEPPVGGHELDRAEAVDRQSELALQSADTPAEGQPGDAGMADDPHGTDEPVLLGSDIELAEQRPAARPREAALGIDGHVVHPTEVDDDAAVGRRMPDRAVATATDGDLEVALAAEPDGGGDVVDARRSDDERQVGDRTSRSRPSARRRSRRHRAR